MDIRTKLVFALVAVALGSMLTFGAFMYTSADHRLRDAAIERLEGLAESRRDALDETIRGWRERVLLIASRTQLRRSLRDFETGLDPEAPDRIVRILEDALEAGTSIAALAVYGLDGRLVAGVGLLAGDSSAAPEAYADPEVAGDHVHFTGVTLAEDGRPILGFDSDLVLDGERVGLLRVRLTGQDLSEITGDYTSLGETGEVLVVMGDREGARTLHSVRHAPHGSSGYVRIRDPADPAFRALAGEESIFTGGLPDYRGESVFAVTRFLPETGWGVVVKFDADEGRAAILEFRSEMIDLALSLAAFAVLVAVLLGIRVANPIHDLAATANRIRVGELDARASVAREDEIGMLSRTFNHMADELEERVKLLHEYKKFFDVSLDMMCIAGTDGYFKRTNPAFKSVLGWGSDQLLGKPFFDLVHPEDLEATRQEIEKLAQGIPTVSFVNRFRCADGRYRSLRWTSYPEPETALLYAVAHPLQDFEQP